MTAQVYEICRSDATFSEILDLLHRHHFALISAVVARLEGRPSTLKGHCLESS
jgi:hypothetical protein